MNRERDMMDLDNTKGESERKMNPDRGDEVRGNERNSRDSDTNPTKRPGETLGVGDTSGGDLPGGKPKPGGGQPQGIEKEEPRVTGIGEMRQGKGATGIDMGAGGRGTD